MPEVAIPLRARFDEAHGLLNDYIFSLPSTRELRKAEVGEYQHRSAVRGWQVPIQFPDQERRLNVLVPATFPFAAPTFCLVDRSFFWIWPHVEEDGALCLLQNCSEIDHEKPVAVFQWLLGKAAELIGACKDGRNLEDFVHEFHSYWNREKNGVPLGIPFLSLLKPAPSSRLISTWRGKDWLLLGEDDASVARWLVNRFGESKTFYDLEKAAFLWMDRPPVPSEYPLNASGVLAIARAAGARELLSDLIAGTPRSVIIVLAANTANGPCLGGVTSIKPRDEDLLGRAHNVLNRGFRPGNVPKELQLARYFDGTTRASRSQVARVDPSWIHGRDKDPYHRTLRSKTVAVVGCGSLGAPLAVQMAMGGVGRLILIDPQSLTWANVGRHPLGAKHVGRGKASSLATELASNYPHAAFEGFEKRWEELGSDTLKVLAECDLLISTMGDWGSEDALNCLHVNRSLSRPVLYCWLEKFAAAGHAVGIEKPGGCLRCHFDSIGTAEFQATVWPDGEGLQEPACGVTFQPYGPVELSFVVAMGSTSALDYLLGRLSGSSHRVWAGSDRLLRDSGGSWSDRMNQEVPDRNPDGGVYEREWTKLVDCQVCKSV